MKYIVSDPSNTFKAEFPELTQALEFAYKNYNGTGLILEVGDMVFTIRPRKSLQAVPITGGRL